MWLDVKSGILIGSSLAASRCEEMAPSAIDNNPGDLRQIWKEGDGLSGTRHLFGAFLRWKWWGWSEVDGGEDGLWIGRETSEIWTPKVGYDAPTTRELAGLGCYTPSTMMDDLLGWYDAQTRRFWPSKDSDLLKQKRVFFINSKMKIEQMREEAY